MNMPLLSPNDIKTYQQNGVLCLPKILNINEINLLEEGIEENLKNLSFRAKIASQGNDTGLFIEDFCNWQANANYRKFIFETKLNAIAAQLMQSQTVRLYHDHMLVKEANTQQITPWHQDLPYYNIMGKQHCSIWIPIDFIPFQSTLKFFRGSHLGPWYLPRTFRDLKAKWFPEGSLLELPRINEEDENIIGWQMEPGDVVFFDMLTLHSAAGTSSSHRRRVFSLRLLGDDIVHAPRPWETSPNFKDLEKELAVGLPMNHELFPIIYSNKSTNTIV